MMIITVQDKWIGDLDKVLIMKKRSQVERFLKTKVEDRKFEAISAVELTSPSALKITLSTSQLRFEV